jgi:hypothetical protein
MLAVGHRVLDDRLKEALEHLPGVVIDERADPLDAASPGQSPDCRLGNALEG